jgi:hypothetical protein
MSMVDAVKALAKKAAGKNALPDGSS